MNKKIIILDDTCKSEFGGTALTLMAFSESLLIQDLECFFIETRELDNNLFNKIEKDSLWIIGNVTNLNFESFKILSYIYQFRKFVKIEFDYGFCRYRCEQGFKYFKNSNKWTPFDEKESGTNSIKNLYLLNRFFAKKILYMSEEQMKIHNKMLDFSIIDNSKQFILGSCFSMNDLSFMLNKNNNNHSDYFNNKIYAIVEGNGGWHSKAKGFEESIAFAKENNIKFEIIKSKNYKDFLNILSQYYGCIFLPNIHDTCPRLTIECKLMGLDIITNSNSQHIKEYWFNMDRINMANFLLERSRNFALEIEKIL